MMGIGFQIVLSDARDGHFSFYENMFNDTE